jgi:hypothetical protein
MQAEKEINLVQGVAQVEVRLNDVLLVGLGMGSQSSSMKSSVCRSKSNKQISIAQQELDGSTSQTMLMQYQFYSRSHKKLAQESYI